MSDAGDRRQALRAGSASHRHSAGILTNKPRTKPVAAMHARSSARAANRASTADSWNALTTVSTPLETAKCGYIEELMEENERLRESNRHSHSTTALPSPNTATATENEQPVDASENDEAERNPLLEDRPWFFPLNTSEMPIHIGEAADAAFATRFRQALSDTPHRHIPRTHYVTDEELMALTDVDCQWPIAPRARFLVKVSLNTICQRFHAIRKSALLDGLEMAIRNPTGCDELFKCKLWAMFALGEVFSTRTVSAQGYFPGLLYFARASRMLRVLGERPRIDSIEILLLLSFYSLTLNRRHAAYYLASSAVRLGIVMGLHLSVPEHQLSDRGAREHRHRIWWTAYVCDRMWASKLGQPASIQDDDIEVDLPSCEGLTGPGADDFGDPDYINASIRLARLATHIIASIYKRKGQHGAFSQRVQQALRNLRSWVEELPSHLQLDTDDSLQVKSRTLVYLHLSFNQFVILATRPILLHVFRTYRESLQMPANSPTPQIPETARALAEACIRCARHSYRLLTESWIDGAFATFGYFDTQYLFSAATILAISSFLSSKDAQSDGDHFETAAQFLGQLMHSGNYAAKEFCRHIDAMRRVMEETRGTESFVVDPFAAQASAAAGGAVPSEEVQCTSGSVVTAGMALAEPSLQEFLSQGPDIDLRFIDTSLYDGGLQSLYWPDLRGEHWMAGGP
ncbi:fungal specific transcription factor domain-containing protein [Diplodia corticola]|uniref:Fungal specific transcription factor domain-containing protein n=1 Tax=Diplodia corticola TaxID=236234 RepID=A0A1J9RMC5_9PEZI|nr:fungal specific transcription factor domain-containing protein [Diplodia corticola]OJD29068.1 fungal specific transcription factor domain-containing protein [Diplodia corticola]